ncbi:hypothetical protein Cni_G07592 [Canna indica]|uniref:Thioredoxin domain-containing protein n=1 Tax=Canna indica TaxID=4628 RepID=A0AAQ3Q506_9LILI|nr:hypothetical protein Cni_G07592 [Canna indica]
MGRPQLLLRLLVLLPVILSSFSFSYPSEALTDLGGESSSGRSSDSTLEWAILTKRNFSSQIRLHRKILLMVTVPWSGEARSLMKEVAHLVANREELDFLKLMVIYKSSEKMLADVLGATEEITLFYYHNSMPHRYHGRRRAENIISSVNYFLSLKPEEVPLKSLNTLKDVENFFQSTDKAVLLLEFCGWSAELLRRKNNGNYETPMSSYNNSENVGITGQSIPGDLVEDFHMEHNEGMEDGLTCGVENGLGSPAWPEYTLANHSAPEQAENGGADSRMSCTYEEFKQFESFFTNFTSIVREYFLPPERQKYGLISENSLSSFLGNTSPNKWLVMLHFSGCSNCTMIVQEVDDLRNILQSHQSLVVEFDADGHDLEPAFPANRPSIVLFIDRSSDSLKVREDSKLSLEVLRNFASQNQLSYQTAKKGDSRNTGSSSEETFSRAWSRSIPGSSVHHTGKVSQTPTIVKIQDNMAFMIVNEGESISLKNTALEDQGNHVYDILARLLQRENRALSTEETRISQVAKKAGFGLLSNDFEVQIVEPLKLQNENDPLSLIDMSTITVLNDPKMLTESYGDASSNELLATAENTIANEETQPDANLLGAQETLLYTQDDNAKLTAVSAEELKTGKWDSKETMYNEENGTFEQGEMVAHLEDFSNPEENLQEEEANKTDCTSSITFSSELKSDFAQSFSVLSAKDDIASIRTSINLKKTDEVGYQHHVFLGSFFFVDGNYQLLQMLTGGSRIPSLVILDPVQQQHFIHPEEMDISYSSVVGFVDRFLNGSLTPYQRSALSPRTDRAMPKPPFVNLDFHEADFIPQVASSTFCEQVMGFRQCEISSKVPSFNSQDCESAWKIDVLVLFSNSWCGFCQRMELVMREVHHTFKNFMNLSLSQSKNADPMQIKVEKEDFLLNKFPSIFLMDCTFNDCGFILKPLGKEENYPVLLLFPAENKNVVMYQGDISVVSIMEFLESHGSNSPYLNKHKGLLWTHSRKKSRDERKAYSSHFQVHEKAYSDDENQNEFTVDEAISPDNKISLESSRPAASHDKHRHVAVGSIVVATDKLLNAVPFDNSTVLIVAADHNRGFQGLIINKRISWDIFKEIGSDLLPLKQAPIFYGGPVRLQNLPLLSLVRKAKTGYTKIANDVYFGNPVATRKVIEEIKSREESSDDYWFFLGFSSWGYNQLFNEFAEGAWQLSRHLIEHLDWPKN